MVPTLNGALRALRGRALSGDPATVLFRRTRWRLALWYATALFVVLLVLGSVLYLTMRQTLLAPIEEDLHVQAARMAQPWVSIPPDTVCPPVHDVEFWACYTPAGRFIDASGAVQFVPKFAPSTLTVDPGNGSREDTVDSPVGTLARYALAVSDSAGVPRGIVVVGEPVGGELHALDRLRQLLLILGAFTTFVALVGGGALGEFALRPVRLAHLRQRQFIADASHELRTPLTILRADAEILLRNRDELSEDDAFLVEDMVRETAQMASLTTTMLDLARLDAGDVHIEKEVVDLRAICRSTATRVQALGRERDVTVTAQTESDEPIYVLGDPLLIEEAMLVLVDNAIKYNHPGGSVTLRAWADAGHNTGNIEVQDTGIGISAEHIPHLGERFYRVDKVRSREMGGAGLGLSIAHRIVAQHGGALDLKSVPGQGTTVTVRLPPAPNGPGGQTSAESVP